MSKSKIVAKIIINIYENGVSNHEFTDADGKKLDVNYERARMILLEHAMIMTENVALMKMMKHEQEKPKIYKPQMPLNLKQ